MAGITKLLGIAIADADAGRITQRQLLQIFQEAIDNGDIVEQGNEQHVVAAVLPLLDAGVLRPSRHSDALQRRIDETATSWLAARKGEPSRDSINPGESPTIVSQANAVGDMLHRYVAIHDDIFAGGLLRTIRRVVPIPGIFQPIAFDEHSEDLAGLAQNLAGIRDRIGSGDAPAQLTDPLLRYCQALLTAVGQLEHITRKLADRKDDPDSYTQRQYKTDLAEYEKVVAAYRAVGEQVNRVFRAVLS